MKKNNYLTPGLTILAGLFFTCSFAIAEQSYNVEEKIKPISSKYAKKNCLTKEGVFLENNYVATCVTQDGTFGTYEDTLGMTFNPEGTGTITTPDFLQPGKAFEFFSLSFNGQSFHNNNIGEQSIDTIVKPLERLSNTNQAGGAIVYSTIQGKDESLLYMTQKYTVDPNAKEIIIRVEMKNIGEKAIEELYYARGIDSDQDVHTHNTHYTLNTRGGSFGGLAIDKENIVQATGKKSHLALGLYSVDSESHNTCISPNWTMDAVAIYHREADCLVKLGAYSNATINLGFKLHSLKPNETEVFSFKYLFDVAKLTKPIDAFIIEVKTDNPGDSANNAFTIPTRAGEYDYNYNVDCDSDGTNEAENVHGDYTCEYAIPGTYTVSIKDNTVEATGFPAIHFEDIAYNAKDNLKLIKIKQWGGGKWLTMEGAFWNCRNMNSTARDVPNLSFVTDMRWMFSFCTRYQGRTISRWNVSNVTNMNSLFKGASTFNQPIGNWDVSQVTDMMQMFYFASSFNQPLGNWDVSHVSNNMTWMFALSSLSTENYDNLLIGWSHLNLQPNIEFDAGNVEASRTGATARDSIVSRYGWTIRDAQGTHN